MKLTPSDIKLARIEGLYDLWDEVMGERFDTRFVPGVGNVNAKVVFVGEGPGTNENREGAPFVGPSGKMFDKGLRSIGLKRQRVWITNLLKHQPPGNRDPEGDEIPISLNLLRKEIQIIDPKIVVTLGRFATSLFFEQPHMSTLAGQAWIRRGFTVIPMFHPASVLYGGYEIEDWLEQFQTVAECLTAKVMTRTTPINGTPVRKGLRHYVKRVQQ